MLYFISYCFRCYSLFFIWKNIGSCILLYYSVHWFCYGYWAVLLVRHLNYLLSNIRATATTTAPNFVRASTILISLLLNLVISVLDVDKLLATKITGAIIISIGFIAFVLFTKKPLERLELC